MKRKVKRKVKRGDEAFETTSPPPFAGPDLESVIAQNVKDHLTPRKRPDENLAITIHSVPADIPDMIWLLKEVCRHVETRSLAQGCLIACGLSALERILAASPKSKRTKLEAIRADDLSGRMDHLSRHYRIIYLGPETIETMTVFCLDEGGKARISEVSTTYGLDMGLATKLAMVVGIAQSTEMLPPSFRERARLEVLRFQKSLEK